MALSWHTTRRVEFRDTDAAGIVHFSVFFLYMEQVEHEFLRQRGLSVVLHDEQGMISWPRVSARCDYRGVVRFEDLLDVELEVRRIGGKSVTWGYRFTHQGRAVAEGELVSVCCRLLAGQPPQAMTIPPWIVARLQGRDEPPSG